MLPQRLKSHRSFCNGTAEAVPSHLSIANSPEMSVTNEQQRAFAHQNGTARVRRLWKDSCLTHRIREGTISIVPLSSL